MNLRRYISTIVILSLFLSCLPVVAQEGRVIRETVYSPSLEGNLFGDSANREVTIYLPPGYDEGDNLAYPVVYLLHGYSVNNNWYVSGTSFPLMDSWLKSNKVKEMIIVMPNSHNRFLGSWYTNSVTTGGWADYIVKDLVHYIDSHYHTLPQRESRAIIGHSTGGYGAMAFGLGYPDVFSCIGSISGVLDMSRWLSILSSACAYASTLKNLSDFDSQGILGRLAIACSVAFCPNPDRPPFYCNFPWELDESNSVVKNESAYNRFMGHDIPTRLADSLEVLLSMREIYIECGIRDEVGLISDLRLAHDELQRLNVPHYYHEFDGNHTSHVMINLGDALEVFSKAMSFEMLVSVEPTGKLAVTWGKIRSR